ncbi:MAG: hypothetical protein IPJ65_32340 [Archangiaceae bacterium]|nr:hypothetical protein [Archangiaceae bacterium]
MSLALVIGLLLGEAKVHQTPPYLPRYATFQLFIRPPAISPGLRLGWEIDLIEGQRDVLVAVLEGGLAYTRVNDAIPFFWQYSGGAGIGYRNQREGGLYWGFTLVLGAIYYGYKLEARADVLAEGRAFLGWKLGPTTLAFTAGYAQWVAYNPYSVAQRYATGPYLGVQLGWK